MGVYISGHPLEEYASLLSQNSTCISQDFVVETEEEQQGMAKVTDGKNVIIGGIITDKKVKTTRYNTLMAYLTLEDMYGTVEVIVFSRVYEKMKELIREDAKVFIRGRVSLEDDKDGKIICRDILPFESLPCELWLRLPDKNTFLKMEQEIYKKLAPYDGQDRVVVYLQEEKQIKKLPAGRCVDARCVIKENVFQDMEQITTAIKERVLQT
jgi:DNA polymerase-3 subunit alpha